MITNAHELFVTLHQLSCFTDVREALRLEAEAKNDYALFAHLSKGYTNKIRELNAEIKDYLQAHPESAELTSPTPTATT